MKRSKVFLGVTTCLLAIVGVAAAKAHKFTKTKIGYFGTHAGLAPTCGRLSHLWYTNGSNIAVTVVGSKSFDVYTARYSSSACTGNTLFSTNAD